MPILQKHINTYSDFARIMAWKIGKIRHFESEESVKCNMQRIGKIVKQ